MYHNVERLNGKWIAYGDGHVWRCRKDGKGYRCTSNQDGRTFWESSLKAVSRKLEVWTNEAANRTTA